MIAKSILNAVLAKAMSTGADFAEVFAERTLNKSINMVDGKVDEIADTVISGVGIRIFAGNRCICASTADISESGLLLAADRVAGALSGMTASQLDAPVVQPVYLRERVFGDIHPIRVVPSDVKNADKIELLKRGYFTARDYHDEIAQVTATLLDVDHNIMVANSEGLYAADRQIRTRMIIDAIAYKDGENQAGLCRPGRRMGLEMFETVITPEEIGKRAAEQAVTMLHAGYCPAGNMTVAIENGFGGVIFHEACGHSLEASSVALGQSQFCGKLGQKIASEKVTAVDDGTIPNAWGSINIDDEGHPAQRNVLIEKGVLKSYMIDRFNGRRMGMEATGNCRRQSYSFRPTSRMTNTMILAGEDKNEDIISSIEYGLYAKQMGGGSVNPVTGDFNFAVREGYIVRNGKICEPVRGASLIGKGSEILQDIDMVGTDLACDQGMCGSSSGSIPTDVGQPLVRVSSITVGGR